MKLRAYRIISDAIDRAITYGYNRAHKHTETPGAEAIKGSIYNEIMNELSEVIDWDHEETLELNEAAHWNGEEDG